MSLKKTSALLMVGALSATSIVPAFAAKPGAGESWFTHNQEAGSRSDMDVNLKVESRTTPVIFSAYVPSAMTIAISRKGKVITPENLRIINGVQDLPIDVKAMKVTAAPGWQLKPWSTDMTKEAYDSKVISMQMNGKDLSDPSTFALPWKIRSAGELPLVMDSNVPYQSHAKDIEEVVVVTFTMDWTDAPGGSDYDNNRLINETGDQTVAPDDRIVLSETDAAQSENHSLPLEVDPTSPEDQIIPDQIDLIDQEMVDPAS